MYSWPRRVVNHHPDARLPDGEHGAAVAVPPVAHRADVAGAQLGEERLALHVNRSSLALTAPRSVSAKPFLISVEIAT